MAGERRARPPKERRRPSREAGARRAVLGCLLFGAGVVVGAMLWPLAKAKTTSISPSKVAGCSPAPRSEEKPVKKVAVENLKSAEGEKLTFFQTLKEGSPREGEDFVPFKPKGEVPPPLEALAPEEAGQKTPEVPSDAAQGVGLQKPLAGGPGYYVQVAAFQYGENARRLKRKLQSRGYPVYIVTAKRGRKLHRVRVGPFESRKDAASLARRLQEAFLYPTLVLKETTP